MEYANIDKNFTEFHKERMGIHCYPRECIIRAMLGAYPELKLAHNYKNANVLDMSCGDGRNLVLLHNLDMRLHATEITKEICDATKERMNNFNIEVDIRVGRNSKIPFDDNYFDYIVASSSIYYLDENDMFDRTLSEVNRVLKKDGYLICTLAHPDSTLFNGAEKLDMG
ncbi:MAG: class I SAM-dependent methyltransferase, partial [Bacteroidales bacterium]|nr:class I SAM-dependent methyltransferase [Bacteroidales bacterium]